MRTMSPSKKLPLIAIMSTCGACAEADCDTDAAALPPSASFSAVCTVAAEAFLFRSTVVRVVPFKFSASP